jgi:hypothetical protein
MGEKMKNMIILMSRYWPLATEKQARRQAVRLIRAKRYLKSRGISAHEVGSKFEYTSGPKVLHGSKGK